MSSAPTPAVTPDISKPAEPTKKPRIESLDAFRGFTILGMVFVIAVAAGGYQWESGSLPQQMRWFGSLPVSTWFHADVAFLLWEREQLDLLQAQGLEADAARQAIAAMPEQNLRNIGVTFTDLIAPWFVFIVGACVPLGRLGKAPTWFWLAFKRAALLILVGMLYISLVIQQISWWWGVLQAIGVAYFMAAACWRLPPMGRWVAVFAVGAFNLVMTELFPWWTNAFKDSAEPFGTLSNPGGDWLRPLTIHCHVWLSISYGTMGMIGVLMGDALISRDRRSIINRTLLLGIVFTLLGYIIHRIGFAIERYSLCFNKVDVTTSYAFFTAGLGALAYLSFYYVMDVLKVRSWAKPLNVFGVNPLVAYFMMIVMRRLFESLGVIHFFNRVEDPGRYAATGGLNPVIHRWAELFGSPEAPSQAVLWFFDKGGYTGMMWGLIWTFCLWLIIVYLNRKNLFWKL